MAFRWIPMVLALTAGLTACAAAGPGDPNTIEPITTTTPVTVAASTTVTTAPPTTSTSTTQPTTSTTQADDPQAATKQEIADLVVKARQAFLDAAADPVNPDSESLSLYYAGSKLLEIRRALQDLVDSGQAIRPAPANKEIVIPVAVQLTDETEGIVIACVASDSIIYEVASEVILDDSTTSFLRSIDVRYVDGRWYVVDITTIDTFEDQLGCNQ